MAGSPMRSPRPVRTLSLQGRDALFVYLATVYHLGRPGSETDALTLERHEFGLGTIRDALEVQLGLAAIEVEISDYQLARLGQALHGVVNELKQYEMAQGRSAVPGFAEAMQRLFPEVGDEPGAALDLVQHAVMLRRRLDAAVRDAESAVQTAREQATQQASRQGRPLWKVWRR